MIVPQVSSLRKTLGLFLGLIFSIGLGRAATEAPDPSGHWEGAITLPNAALDIQIDLSRASDQSWQGTINIPAQGLRAFKLTPVTVTSPTVAFAMPGVPGNPRFTGTFSPDGTALSGEFNQGTGKFPFELKHKSASVENNEIAEAGIPGQGLTGYWLGSIKPTPAMELRLALEITGASAEALKGTLISIDQGAARIPFSRLTENGSDAHLEVKQINATFDGKFNANGSELAGDWKQGAGILPLTFKRQAKPLALNRPQEPKRPFPYTDEEVVVPNEVAQVTLAGTLTLPPGPGPHPAVVLITGSGAQDRDEALASHRPFLVLADYLTRQGIAVLRCDDRGFAKSTGKFSTAIEGDFVEDTMAGVAFLRARPEIDSRRIGLIGHSEGGMIAPRAAAKSADIAFIVLLAGVGVPFEQVLLRQGRDISEAMGVPEAQVAKNATLTREMIRLVKLPNDPAETEKALRDLVRAQMASLTDEQKAALPLTSGAIDAQIKLVLSPWFRDLLTYDPVATLRQVTCPVLALNGGKDLQVAAKENLPAMEAALKSGRNQNFQTHELPGLNHLFQHCETGAPTEYSRIEETFDPATLKLIADWIHQVAPKQQPRSF